MASKRALQKLLLNCAGKGTIVPLISRWDKWHSVPKSDPLKIITQGRGHWDQSSPPFLLETVTHPAKSHQYLCNPYGTIKNDGVGLPWWRSGWESACQCRGHGVEPWSGRIPRAVEQLGPWATIAEPARLEPVLRNKRGHDGERPAHRDEEWPPLAATGEGPRTETKTQHSQK